MLGANSIVAIAALVLMPPSRLAAQKDAIASLAATKSSYLLGEPIALKLRVTNNSASTVSIIGNYPTFAYNAAIGIKCALISIPSRASANSPEFRDPAVNRSATSPPDDFWIKSGGGKTSIVRIATGSDWSIEVYLQRFMKQFPAGVHDVAYSINLAVQPPEPGPGLTIEGRGVLGIVITPASDGQLLGMIEELARARPQDADYRPFEESLSLVSSPLIIPYLGKIIPYCLTKSPVLAKFKGNAEAADLVAATALKGGGFQTVSALSVLQEWDFPLKHCRLRAGLGQRRPVDKSCGPRVCGEGQQPQLSARVSAYTSDGDDDNRAGCQTRGEAVKSEWYLEIS